MPKAIELTVELDVQKVSCPGVWLCQDGRVALNLFALGTTYQTCLLPPIFPLTFRDVFYFRKRFQDTMCSLSNICCLLKNETIYCELVQFCNDCGADQCTVLAQYLGALNDVLFPPNMCTTEGVDLLMRRSNEFPGILAPKIEVKTKMRLDEVWVTQVAPPPAVKVTKPCKCPGKSDADGVRQHSVCHTPLYHRIRCTKRSGTSRSRSRGSRSRSEASRSLCSINIKDDMENSCECPNPMKSRASLCGSARKQRYQVYMAPSIPNWIDPKPGPGLENREYHTNLGPSKENRRYSTKLECCKENRGYPTKLECGNENREYVNRRNLNPDLMDFALGITDKHPGPYDNFQSRDKTVHSLHKHSKYGPRKSSDDDSQSENEQKSLERTILESYYIEQQCEKFAKRKKKTIYHKPGPCTCEICHRCSFEAGSRQHFHTFKVSSRP